MPTHKEATAKSGCIVRKLKFDGSVKSEWEGDLLPAPVTDWLVILHHHERHVKVAGSAVVTADLLFVHCHHMVQPLTVLLEYEHNGRFRGAKCDAALPASIVGSVIEFVDLDLDLIVETDLSCTVQDEETFTHHRQVMRYPERVVQQARAGLALARELVATRRFPFDAARVPQLSLDGHFS